MRSVLHCLMEQPSAGANLTRYTGLGKGRWHDGQGLSYGHAGGQQPWSAPGVLHSFYFQARQTLASQGITSVRMRLFKNFVATGVDFTISDATSGIGSDFSTEVTVAAGDIVYWREDPTPAFPTVVTRTFPAYWKSCEFDSDDVLVSVYGSNQVDGGNSGDWTGFPFTMDDDLENDADRVNDLHSFSSTTTRLDVKIMDALTGAQTVTVTPYKNDVAQDGTGGTTDERLTIVAGSGTTDADGGQRHSKVLTLSCVRGDRTYCRITSTNLGGVTPRMSMSTKVVAAVAQFWIGGREGGPASNSIVNYNQPVATTLSDSFDATESNVRVFNARSRVRLTGEIRWIKVGPGSGKSWTMDVMQNGAEAEDGPSLTLSGSATTGETATGSVTLAAGDTYTVRETPVGSPTVTGFDGQAWAFVGAVADDAEVLDAGIIGPLVWWHFRRRVPDAFEASSQLEAESPLAPPVVGGGDPPADPDDGDGEPGTITVGEATYFVSTTGSDSNPGTQGSPFLTVAHGVSVLNPGQTLMVRGGDYLESLLNTVPAGTSWASAVRIAGYPTETVWLKPSAGSDRVLSFRGEQRYIIFDAINLDGRNCLYDIVKINGITTSDNAHHIRLQNLEIKNAPLTSHGMHVICTALVPNIIGGNEFLNVIVHAGGSSDFAHAYYLQSPNNRVQGGEIYDIAGACVHIYNGYGQAPSYNLVDRVYMHDGRAAGGSQRGWGVLIGGGVGNKVHNAIVDTIVNSGGGSAGVYVYAGEDAEIYHTTVYGCAAYGVRIESGVLRTIVRNVIGNSNAGGNYSDAGTGTIASHNIFEANPLFVNAVSGNFQLQAGSPAIDTGINVGVDVDFNSVARPQGAAVDIGAFEKV